MFFIMLAAFKSWNNNKLTCFHKHLRQKDKKSHDKYSFVLINWLIKADHVLCLSEIHIYCSNKAISQQ